VAVQPEPPATPGVGDLWVDSDGAFPEPTVGFSAGGDLYLAMNYF
jgi:hypothetical protein